MSAPSPKGAWRRLRPARAALLAAAALLIASGIWTVVRLYLPTDGAPVLTDNGYARGFTVDPLPSDPTPLQAGDLVVGIEGTSLDDVLHGASLEKPQLRAGATWRYQVLRDGETREITVTLRQGRHFVGERLRAGASVLLIALTLVVLGVWVVARRPDHPAARALLVLGAGLTAYQLFQVLSTDMAALPAARPLFAIGIAGHVGALSVWATAAAHLAWSFPEPTRTLRRHKWLPGMAYAGMFAATAGLQGGALVTHAVGANVLNGFYSAMVVVLYALVIATFAGLARTMWRVIRDPAVRRQGALVAFGMATTFVILTSANVFAADEPLPAWFPVLAFLPMPASLAVAIVRGEFLDLRATINRALVFTSLTAVLLGTYVFVAVSLGALVGSTGLAATIPATGVVAVALAPLRSLLQRGVDRIIYGQRGDPARVLSDLGRRLDAALPADEVLGVVAETLAGSLRLPYVGITIIGDGGRRVACERGDPSDNVETLPLVRQGTLVGELIVGPRRGQRSLTRQDRALLTDVARQVASAVDATRLLTELVASRRVIAVAREEERAQLRHDIHDRLGSRLTGLTLQLDSLRSQVPDPTAARAAESAHAEAERALDEVRRISRGLRPAELDELGLGPAIDAATRRLSADYGRWTAAVDSAVQLPAVPAPVASAAYHIVIEALANAHRHSGGDSVRVRVGVSADGSRLTVEVSDNGRGIDTCAIEGVGVKSMRERAAGVGGTLEIAGGADGTTVRAALPISSDAALLKAPM